MHLDFFEFNGLKYLIFIDSFSKWVEIVKMNVTDADKLIKVLNKIWTNFGRPQKLVTDNGPPFNSFQFKNYCSNIGIQLLHSPPYHPQSNGIAERAVQTAKNMLKKMLQDQKLRCLGMDVLIERLLFSLRNAHLDSIASSPAKLLFKFQPRSSIEDLLPESSKIDRRFDGQHINNKSQNVCKDQITNTNKNMQFRVDDLIWYRNKKENYARKGRIIRINSGYTFYIALENEEKVMLAHLNQLKLRLERREVPIISPTEEKISNKRKANSPIVETFQRKSQRVRKAPIRFTSI